MSALPAGSQLFRCHPQIYGADQFNPGSGPSARFQWVMDASGAKVPCLYAGQTLDCALFETIFHNVPATASRGFVAGRNLLGRRTSEISTGDILNLVELHDPGLLKLGLRPGNLTATTSRHYDRTLMWSQAIYDQVPDAEGLIWMSARMNTAKSIILYGDRVPATKVSAGGTVFDLDEADGAEYVVRLGERAGITVSWPSGVSHIANGQSSLHG